MSIEQQTSATAKPRLMTANERVLKYGKPASIVGGALAPDAKWERACIVRAMVPWPGKDGVRMIRVHRDVRDQFIALFTAWRDANLLHLVVTNDGTVNIRMKRGKEKSLDLRDLSTHAFGAAIDINAKWNPLNAKPAAIGCEGSVVELVPIANRLNFVWGGDFSTVDAMHFEVGVAT